MTPEKFWLMTTVKFTIDIKFRLYCRRRRLGDRIFFSNFHTPSIYELATGFPPPPPRSTWKYKDFFLDILLSNLKTKNDAEKDLRFDNLRLRGAARIVRFLRWLYHKCHKVQMSQFNRIKNNAALFANSTLLSDKWIAASSTNIRCEKWGNPYVFPTKIF